MSSEKSKQKNNELIKSFWKREKTEITPDDLKAINIQEIKTWAWCTGMGSDAYILFNRNDGSILEYNHYKYSKNF